VKTAKDIAAGRTADGPSYDGATAPPSALGDRVRSLRLPAEAYGRSSSKLPWLLCVILAGVVAWLLFARNRHPETADGEKTAGSPKAVDLSDSAPVLDSEFALESKGYIIPTQQILLSPKVSGVVTKLTFEEGDRVKEGALLAEIEDTDYKSDRDRASATLHLAQERLAELEHGNRPEEVSQAKAELEEARVQLEKLASDFKRATDLRRRGLITEEEFQDIDSKNRAQARRVDRLKYASQLMNLGAREERIRAAQAEVKQAEADLAKANWRLNNCKIFAPVSGTILQKEAEEGNLVNPIAFSGSRSLCEMADLSKLEVDLSIVERDIAKVHLGQECRIHCEAYPNRLYHGVVSRLMPIADRAKGAVSVRVKLTVPANEEGVYLKPEMSAQVTFLNQKSTPRSDATRAAAAERPADREVEQSARADDRDSRREK
jgi:multidrug resistance efflux pump